MKYFMILISFLTLFGCKTHVEKMQVTAIYSEPKRVTREIPETGRMHTFTTRTEVTERLQPTVEMLYKSGDSLKLRIQGNINSSGLSINRVRKIRLEKGEQYGNSITLKYYVEIVKIAGKEGNTIKGYNYVKDEIYTIPNTIKLIKIELYEDRMSNSTDTKPKLIAQQTFNFFAKI